MLTVFSSLVLLFPNKAEASKYMREGKYASIVMDAENGYILNEINSDKKLHPASLTKMMTLYLTFDELKSGKLNKNTYIRTSWKAASQPPSSLGLKTGDAIRVETAILALVTKSANDVAVALAEAIGGSEENFAKIMTKKAQELGMGRTVFKNASGLHRKDQVSTAYDMAVLAKALIDDHKEYYHYFSTPSFNYNGLVLKNHNSLMKSYEGMDGLKTGYIGASGFNVATSAVRDGRRIIGVVFGGKTSQARNMIMSHLLDKGFVRMAELRGKKIRNTEVAQIAPVRRPYSAKINQEIAENDYDENIRIASLDTKASEESWIEKIQKKFSINRVFEPDQGDAALEDEKLDTSKNWVIQVGVFKDKYKSLQAIKNAKRDLGYLIEAQDAIAPLETDRGTIYRARITGVSLNTARSACSILKDSCLVLTDD